VASVLPKCVAVAALAFIMALAVAACGETKDESSANAPKSSGERTTTTRETATATTETEAEAAPDPDTDGDGTADADDYAPKNPKIQDESQKDDCDVLGINATKLREGSCKTDKGMRIKVVNRDSKLVLPEVAVHLNSIEAATSIARPYDTPLVGSFVVAEVSMTNRLDVPVEVDASDQFALQLDSKTFNPNFDAMNNGDNSLIYEEIQPEETVTGKVIFRVSRKRARALDANGNLIVLQFSDSDTYGNPKKRIGVIRTYH